MLQNSKVKEENLAMFAWQTFDTESPIHSKTTLCFNVSMEQRL